MAPAPPPPAPSAPSAPAAAPTSARRRPPAAAELRPWGELPELCKEARCYMSPRIAGPRSSASSARSSARSVDRSPLPTSRRRQPSAPRVMEEVKLPALPSAEDKARASREVSQSQGHPKQAAKEAKHEDPTGADLDWKRKRRRGHGGGKASEKRPPVAPKKAGGGIISPVPAVKLDIPTKVQLDLPNVEMICRASYQAGLVELSKQESALATHRRQQDLAAKRRTRSQAAKWRRSCERKEREMQREMQLRKQFAEIEQEACEELDEVEEEAEEGCASRRSSVASRASRRASSAEAGRRRSSRLQGLMSSGPLSARDDCSRRGYSAAVKRTLASIKRLRPAAYPDPEELQDGEREAFQLHGTRRSRDLARRVMGLSEEERTELQDVFEMYDRDGSGLLESEELRHALYEVGLRCVDAAERRELARLCEAKANGKVGCDFAEFAVDLVPHARKALNQRRHGNLQKTIKACRRDWKGRLSVEEVLEAVEQILPVELLDVNDLSPERQRRMEEVRKHTVEFVKQEDLDLYFSSVMRVVEDQQRIVSMRQRMIQSEHGIDEITFQDFRYQLLCLERIFTHVDHDQNGELSADEVMDVFRALGVAPKSQTEQRKIKAMLDSSVGADFPMFLGLVAKIREMYMSQPDEALQRAFEKVAAENHEGGVLFEDLVITTAQLRGLLEEIGAIPPRKAAGRVRDSLTLVLEELDPEGVELFGYEDLKRIQQRVREEVRQEAVQMEANQLQECGFDEGELEDLQWVFDRLDEDGKGVLSKTEVRQALSMLGVEFKREIHFQVAYHTLDANESGYMEFLEFLQLMKMVRDKQGSLKPDTTPVSNLAALDSCDMILLLDCMGVPCEASFALKEQEMLERACDLLEVGPVVALWPACGCSCLRDLFKHARQHAELRRAG